MGQYLIIASGLLQISSILSVMPPDCGTDCDKGNEAQSGNTPYGVNEDIDSNAIAEDLRARARVTRRTNINFFRLGIFAGEKIHFLSNRETDENIYAEIIDSKQKCLNINAGDTRIFSPLLLRRKRADC